MLLTIQSAHSDRVHSAAFLLAFDLPLFIVPLYLRVPAGMIFLFWPDPSSLGWRSFFINRIVTAKEMCRFIRTIDSSCRHCRAAIAEICLRKMLIFIDAKQINGKNGNRFQNVRCYCCYNCDKANEEVCAASDFVIVRDLSPPDGETN